MNTVAIAIVGESAFFPGFAESCRNISVGCVDLRAELVNHLLEFDQTPVMLLIAAMVEVTRALSRINARVPNPK